MQVKVLQLKILNKKNFHMKVSKLKCITKLILIFMSVETVTWLGTTEERNILVEMGVLFPKL